MQFKKLHFCLVTFLSYPLFRSSSNKCTQSKCNWMIFHYIKHRFCLSSFSYFFSISFSCTKNIYSVNWFYNRNFSAVETWLTRVTDGDIQLAVISQIARLAGADIAIVTVAAQSTILTWIWHAFVHIFLTIWPCRWVCGMWQGSKGERAG